MRQFLQEVTGLGLYPSLSFILFGLCFLLVLFLTFTRSKKHYDHVKRLPLMDDDPQPSGLPHFPPPSAN